jgi:hypothetical protein
MAEKSLQERIGTITIAPFGLEVEGLLGLPADAKGIVLFAHGKRQRSLQPAQQFRCASVA